MATELDLPRIAAIQLESPEAAQWSPAEYLKYDCGVAAYDDHVAGFVVTRKLASEAEVEILNIAVAPEFRRRGIGRFLLRHILAIRPREVFLEVRESNTVALTFYRSLGFKQLTARYAYYHDPSESAIVMKFYSC